MNNNTILIEIIIDSKRVSISERFIKCTKLQTMYGFICSKKY